MEKDIQDAIKDLRDKQTEIAASFEVLKSEPTKKDFWDKFSAISTFLSGVLVALIALYFTYTYNESQRQRDAMFKEQQINLSKLQTIDHLMPHLTATEKEKEIALMTISSLGHGELASHLAELSPTHGSIAALASLIKSGDYIDIHDYKLSLQNIFKRTFNCIVRININDRKDSSPLYGVLLKSNGYIVTCTKNPSLFESNSDVTISLNDYRTERAKIIDIQKNKIPAFVTLQVFYGGPFQSVVLSDSKSIITSGDVLAIGRSIIDDIQVPISERAVSIPYKIETAHREDIDDINIFPVFNNKYISGNELYLLIDFDGRVIGVSNHDWSDSNRHNFVRSDVILNYLKSIEII